MHSQIIAARQGVAAPAPQKEVAFQIPIASLRGKTDVRAGTTKLAMHMHCKTLQQMHTSFVMQQSDQERLMCPQGLQGMSAMLVAPPLSTLCSR